MTQTELTVLRKSSNSTSVNLQCFNRTYHRD